MLPGKNVISPGRNTPLLFMFVGFTLQLIPQEYLASRPGQSIDEDPGWADLEEKWLRPKIPRDQIRALLEEKRVRLAKEEELKKAEKARKRGAPKSTKDAVAKTSSPKAKASPIKVNAEKKSKKTPEQQLLQFPKSGRTGAWFSNF